MRLLVDIRGSIRSMEDIIMEFLILSSCLVTHRKREKIIMQAVIEAAERLGIPRIVKRRCNVLSTGVYLVDRKEKRLIYNDWEKDWNRNRIYEKIMSSLESSGKKDESGELVLILS